LGQAHKPNREALQKQIEKSGQKALSSGFSRDTPQGGTAFSLVFISNAVCVIPHGTTLRGCAALMSVRSEDLIRRLGRRYVAVLGMVAGLLVLDQAVLQPLLARLGTSAPVINLAGRQRMYSQQMVKDCLAIAVQPADSRRSWSTLEATLKSWSRVHRGLVSGDSGLGLIRPSDPGIALALENLKPEVTTMERLVGEVISNPSTATAAVPQLLSAERRYLPAMDRVVQLFERETQFQVRKLRWIALASTSAAIGLMVGLYWLVLRPAALVIRRQVSELQRHEQELERRVEDRTRQLMESLRALEEANRDRDLSNQRTRQLQDQLATASRINSLGELATGIAHEINQPLGAIANDAESLQLLIANPAMNVGTILRTSQRLSQSAERAGQIVRRMRNFLRPRNRPAAPEAINPLILDVVALCRPELIHDGIDMDVELAESEGAQAAVDPIQLQQVLVNLINNARQALAPSSAASRRIEISTKLSDGAVEISVEDNGPGFQVHPDRLFENRRSTKTEGLGLGLSISRSIVIAFRGTMTCSNRNNGGAAVQVRLPLFEPTAHREFADCLCH
jgi:two-component system, LuxR family, sensor kinase FixL